MTEPVSLATIKVHLRLDASGTGEDTYLNGLITAARRVCEQQINRSALGGPTALMLDAFPAVNDPTMTVEARRIALQVALPGGKATAVTAITWRDGAGTINTLDVGEYVAGLGDIPARVAPIGAWPGADGLPGAVTISYTLAALPADDLTVFAQAMLLVIGHWYENRESVTADARGNPAEVPQSASWLLSSLTSYGGR